MIDLGVSKLALFGAVALIVIGPEKLPGVARTIGTLIGKAQRYVADVKAEVNRSIELDALKKVKESVETAARDVEQSVHSTHSEFEKDWADTTASLSDHTSRHDFEPEGPQYQHPGKKWRLKRGAMPHWYKARHGVKTRALSSAARVARFRPKVSSNV